MSLLVCAATGPELAGLLPDFAPPLTADAQSGKDSVADAYSGKDSAAAPTDWPEMQLWPIRLKTVNALCCITGIGPINAALAMGHVLSRAAAEGTPVSAVLNAGLAGAFDLEARPLLSHCLVR